MSVKLLLVPSSSQIPVEIITAAVKFVGKPVLGKNLYPILEPIETPPLVSDS